ncbi:MAG: CorA family divalent cation transporter [Eubacterium sp.]
MLITAGYVNFSELEKIYRQFNLSIQSVEQCRQKNGFFSSDIEVYDDYSFVKLNLIDAKNMGSSEDCLGFFIKKNLLLVVDIDDRDCSNRNIFMKALARSSCESITIEKLVCIFLEGLILRDNHSLELAEIKINSLEEMVLKSRADKDFNLKLLNMKKELLALRGYYEQLIDIGEALRENENDLFDKEELKSFKIFTDKAVRLKENVDLLRSSVVHLWDAYQAYLDMKLSQTMKIFTLVTTIFFPLTLIVGWYGMNFKYMPELNWRYGYVFVICLSAVVVGVLFLWFKKKKWI